MFQKEWRSSPWILTPLALFRRNTRRSPLPSRNYPRKASKSWHSSHNSRRNVVLAMLALTHGKLVAQLVGHLTIFARSQVKLASFRATTASVARKQMKVAFDRTSVNTQMTSSFWNLSQPLRTPTLHGTSQNRSCRGIQTWWAF